MNRIQRFTIALALFTLMPITIYALTELNKTVLVWRIRIVDFADLVVLMPLYLATLYTFHRIMMRSLQPDQGWLDFFSFAAITVFLYGHAMHLTANAINTYSTEIHNYRVQIPDDVYELLYFFDEQLGHLLIFTALFFLLLFYSYIHHTSPWLDFPLRARTCIGVLGLIFGAGQAIALIEASLVSMLFVYAICCGLVLGALIGRQPEPIQVYFRRRPWPLFTLGVLAGLVLTTVVYYYIVGGFIQPSHLS